MKYAIVIVGVTDLRRRPDSLSERLNQALFGTAVIVGQLRNQYVKVRLSDGYSGWCRRSHIDIVAKNDWDKYQGAKKRQVKKEHIRAKLIPTSQNIRLFFGCQLRVISRKGVKKFYLPNGISGQINPGDIDYSTTPVTGLSRRKKIVTTARRFLGVPYLWGGITPGGYDCSGLVQIVYRFHGVNLPRDSKDQRRVGEEIDYQDLLAGDLLFFPGHVAISLGGDNIIHASASRGMIAIDSLNKSSERYRGDLADQFQFARRLPL